MIMSCMLIYIAAFIYFQKESHLDSAAYYLYDYWIIINTQSLSFFSNKMGTIIRLTVDSCEYEEALYRQ